MLSSICFGPQVSDGSLTVTSVSREDRGAYTCRAYSIQGEAVHTTHLLVQGRSHFLRLSTPGRVRGCPARLSYGGHFPRAHLGLGGGAGGHEDLCGAPVCRLLSWSELPHWLPGRGPGPQAVAGHHMAWQRGPCCVGFWFLLLFR